jgi:prepilin-type N-terminal cleavage/methylation domain-containing protein
VRQRAGFTLAEVAVTIVIVGVGLVLVLQSLNSAKLTVAQTRNLKLAKELAMFTLGQIESGKYWEDADRGRFEGTYADQGYPDFHFEVVLGEETFREEYEEDPARAFDNWRYDEDYDQQEEDAEEQAEEAYEQVQIKITFPAIKQADNTLILERWIAWDQVYEPAEKEEEGAEAPK